MAGYIYVLKYEDEVFVKIFFSISYIYNFDNNIVFVNKKYKFDKCIFIIKLHKYYSIIILWYLIIIYLTLKYI